MKPRLEKKKIPQKLGVWTLIWLKPHFRGVLDLQLCQPNSLRGAAQVFFQKVTYQVVNLVQQGLTLVDTQEPVSPFASCGKTNCWFLVKGKAGKPLQAELTQVKTNSTHLGNAKVFFTQLIENTNYYSDSHAKQACTFFLLQPD